MKPPFRKLSQCFLKLFQDFRSSRSYTRKPPTLVKRQQGLRLRCPIVHCETRWYVGNIHCGECYRQEFVKLEKFLRRFQGGLVIARVWAGGAKGGDGGGG